MQSERDQGRKVVIDLLTMLASPEKQLAYQQDVPIADVPAELVCSWFDDNDFGPGSVFESYFDPEEWRAIHTFNNYYASRFRQLPKTSDVGVLLRSDIWQEIVGQAKLACSALGV